MRLSPKGISYGAFRSAFGHHFVKYVIVTVNTNGLYIKTVSYILLITTKAQLQVFVIPAKAGIQFFLVMLLDSRKLPRTSPPSRE